MNVPFTDKQGRINPVWYEFFRSFLADAVTLSDPDSVEQISVVAGAGLVENENDDSEATTLAVGAGAGLAVNANDVAVDIANLNSGPIDLNDEMMFSDINDNNTIRKANLRTIGGLIGASPGGENTYVQYNDNGFFGANSGLTYNGSNILSLGGTLTFNNTTISSASSSNKFVFNVPAGTSTTHYTFRQTTASGSSDMPALFGSSLSSTDLIIDNNIDAGGSTTTESRLKFARTGITKWTMGLESSSAGSKFIFAVSQLNTGVVYNIDPTNSFFNMVTSLTRSTAAGLTASTTQTQGQGALTADINEVATVANANDVRTLPAALAGRSCLVINNGANTLQVFPASGDNLGAGLNASTTITAGSRKLFVAFDSTSWEPVI